MFKNELIFLFVVLRILLETSRHVVLTTHVGYVGTVAGEDKREFHKAIILNFASYVNALFPLSQITVKKPLNTFMSR